jgi:hypothetical protein
VQRQEEKQVVVCSELLPSNIPGSLDSQAGDAKLEFIMSKVKAFLGTVSNSMRASWKTWVSVCSLVFVTAFSWGIGVLTVPDYWKARVCFAIGSIALAIALLALTYKLLSRRIVCYTVSILTALLALAYTWNWTFELETAKTQGLPNVPGLSSLIWRWGTYLSGLPWQWILAGATLGVVLTIIVIVPSQRQRILALKASYKAREKADALLKKAKQETACPDPRLHGLKLGDKSELRNLVKICGVQYKAVIEGNVPAHLEFMFSVLNISLYTISVESVGGYISFFRCGNGIIYKPKLDPRLEGNKAQSLGFRRTGHFVIQQYFLNPDEREYILKAPAGSTFFLKTLEIKIIGDELEPTLLNTYEINLEPHEGYGVWLDYNERYFFSSGTAAQKAQEERQELEKRLGSTKAENEKLIQEMGDWKDAAKKGLETKKLLEIERDQLKAIVDRYGPFHRLVDLDIEALDSRVTLESWELRDLEENLRKYCLLFSLKIKNDSAADVFIDKDPTGNIWFNDLKLLDAAHLSDNNMHPTPPRSKGNLTIEQRLGPSEAALIRDARDTALNAEGPGNLKFSFHRLDLSIRVPGFEFDSKRLILGILDFDARSGAGIPPSGKAGK